MSNETVIFVTTSSSAEAEQIARALVAEKLAACANIISSVHSIFRWQGQICEEKEALMVIKSTVANLHDIIARVKQLHSYDVPEVIALPIVAGSEDYLQWLHRETRKVNNTG
ncbi:MAG: divalent-cation tolerance protein CutA [bacterium]